MPSAGAWRHRKVPTDPHFRDYVWFYEHFHGDNGEGLGASHQTGWTGIVARILHLFGTMQAEEVEASRTSYFERTAAAQATAATETACDRRPRVCLAECRPPRRCRPC
jgi:hypothetical protein